MCLGGGNPDNRQHSALGRLFESSIGFFAAVFKSAGERLCINKIKPVYALGKALENQRKNNSRVSACTSQKLARRNIRKLSRAVSAVIRDCPRTARKSQRKICARVAVGNGENIEAVYLLRMFFNVFCGGAYRFF